MYYPLRNSTWKELERIKMSGVPNRLCENWISTYLKATAKQESPEEFHIWTALSMIAATVERNVQLYKGYLDVYPNLYIVLIAGSGVVKKSTALKIGINIFAKAFEDYDYHTEKSRPEALIRLMCQHYKKTKVGYVYIVADEFHVLIGKSKQDQDLISSLTQFYDCPKQTGQLTIARGLERCHNVCCNMIATTTPHWLRLALPSEVIGGGFTSRIVFVFADSCDRRFPYATYPEGFEIMARNLAYDLQSIRKLKGTIKLDTDADEWYKDWYMKREELTNCPEMLIGYYSRKPNSIFKIATLLSIARSNSLTVSLKDFQMGKQLLETQEVHLPKVIQLLRSSVIGEANERVMTIIQRGKEISYPEMLRKISHYMGAVELNTVLDTLVDSEMVTAQKRNRVVYYTVKKRK